MKNIEDINKETIKKILGAKKYQLLVLAIHLKLVLDCRGKRTRIQYLKEYAYLKKIEI